MKLVGLILAGLLAGCVSSYYDQTAAFYHERYQACLVDDSQIQAQTLTLLKKTREEYCADWYNTAMQGLNNAHGVAQSSGGIPIQPVYILGPAR
jgi:hypothetical protein